MSIGYTNPLGWIPSDEEGFRLEEEERKALFERELAEKGFAGWCPVLHTVGGRFCDWLPRPQNYVSPAEGWAIAEQFERFRCVDRLEELKQRAAAVGWTALQLQYLDDLQQQVITLAYEGEPRREISRIVREIERSEMRAAEEAEREAARRAEQEALARALGPSDEFAAAQAAGNPFAVLAALKG